MENFENNQFNAIYLQFYFFKFLYPVTRIPFTNSKPQYKKECVQTIY